MNDFASIYENDLADVMAMLELERTRVWSVIGRTALGSLAAAALLAWVCLSRNAPPFLYVMSYFAALLPLAVVATRRP